MTGSLTIAAPAKVNLSLHITGRREDGFHTLESVIGFTRVCDHILLSPSNDLSLTVSGPEAADVGPDQDNLALKAASFMQAHIKTTDGVCINLEKQIPVAAGLGGGSADAAATLKACSRWWGDKDSVPIADSDLALALGADVPVCRLGRAAFVTGIGEHVSPVAVWPKTWLVLVNPRIALSTAAVFKAFAGPMRDPAPPPAIAMGWGETPAAFAAQLKQFGNALTHAATDLAPAIDKVLEVLNTQQGCLLARMTGSGPTCFGLFALEAEADDAAATISAEHPDWWVRTSPLLSETGQNTL